MINKDLSVSTGVYLEIAIPALPSTEARYVSYFSDKIWKTMAWARVSHIIGWTECSPVCWMK